MARMRAEDRRRQLLEVAADLFARHGYRGTTTAELARAAGITEPILYRHFDNKLDLFITLLDEVGVEVVTAWQTALDRTDDPTERLDILLASNPATHARGQGVYRVIFQAMTELEHDRAIAAALRRHLSHLHAFIRDEVESLQASGIMRRDQPASMLAWLLVDLAIGYGMVAPLRLSGRAQSSPEAMRALVASLVMEEG